MIFNAIVVAVAVVATCQGTKHAHEDRFSKYFQSAASLKELSPVEHAGFAFGENSAKVVDKLAAPEVYSNGFVYVNVYDDNACNGNVISVSGRPTNVCLLAYEDESSATPTGSYRYSCDGTTSYTEQFTDLECTQSLPMLQQTMFCTHIPGRTASERGFCNEEPAVLPLPNDEFVTQSQFDSPTTCDATYEQFESFLTGHCFPVADTSKSIKYDAANSYEYPSADCTGTPVVTALSQECVPVTEYPTEVINNVASQWSFGEVKTGLFNGPGYVWANLYQSKQCQGVVAAQEGHPTNVCLLKYDNATNGGEPTGSYTYKCNQFTNALFTYTDLECKEGEVQNDRDLGCGDIVGRFGSAKGVCNSDPTQLPLPVGKYVVESLYNSPTECTTVSQFNTFQDDTCFHQGNTGFAYQFPNVSFYADPTCSTEPTSTATLPQECNTVTQWPADTHVASQWALSDIPYVPTVNPTEPPTAAPTPAAYGKGYLYVDLYSERNCAGPIHAVTGVPTETCITSYDDPTSAEPTGSVRYECTGSQSTTYKYSDANCQTQVETVSNDLNCRNVIGRAGSARGLCNSDASELPLPASNFTSKLHYDSPTSCGTLTAFESYQDGWCFNNGGGTSFKYDFPTAFYYPIGSTCTPGTAVGSTNLTTTCTEVTTYPIAQGGDHVAYKWAYGDVKFSSGGDDDSFELTTPEIAGIAAGGAVVVVGVAAGAYYAFGSSAAAASSGAASGAGASAANPMVSAV